MGPGLRLSEPLFLSEDIRRQPVRRFRRRGPEEARGLYIRGRAYIKMENSVSVGLTLFSTPIEREVYQKLSLQCWK